MDRVRPCLTCCALGRNLLKDDSGDVLMSFLRLLRYLTGAVSVVILAPMPAQADIPDGVRAVWQRMDDLQLLLKERQFDALDSLFGSAHRLYEKGTLPERELEDLLDTVGKVTDPDNEAHLVEWATQRKDSYAAQLLAGRYLFMVGRQWRGSGYSSEVAPWRFDKLHDYLARADHHLTAAVALSRKPVHAYKTKIMLARYQGRKEDAQRWLAAAIAVAPDARGPRLSYQVMLMPQWGGSEEAMRAFSEAARKAGLEDVAREGEAMIIGQQARAAWRASDLVKAHALFGEALSHARVDDIVASHIQLLLMLGHVDQAVALSSQALLEFPLYGDLLYRASGAYLSGKRIADGLEVMNAGARMGDTAAMMALGGLLSEGEHGVPIDVEKGRAWMLRSAHYQLPEALFWLGQTYAKGIGVPVDHARAFGYYKGAAEQHHVQAMNELGLAYWYGRGTAPDHDLAAELWLQVARQGKYWQGRHNLHYFFSLEERLYLLKSHPADYKYLLTKENLDTAKYALYALVLIGAWIVFRLRRRIVDFVDRI